MPAMEPWLDSLSEDWKSQQRSSSPAPSLQSNLSHGSVALNTSQSRIPHLANNIRKPSTSGSFLRHRSSYGKARQNSQPVLREKSASNLNLPPAAASEKHSNLPRRISNTFSDSQNSVQHHSVRKKSVSAETPEWKKRLAAGEDVNSDGFDLFSPSKLEGVFKQPNSSQILSDRDIDSTENKPFNLPTSRSFDQFSSYRGTRSRINLEVLEEVNEDEEPELQSLSAISSDVVNSGSLRGLVQQRVKSLEVANEKCLYLFSSRTIQHNSDAQDPRLRSVSGLEELRNEIISPVTVSKQDSIRNTALRKSFDVDVDTLQRKLQEIAMEDERRPTSSASDSYVDYATNPATEKVLHDETLPDLTTQSLPDDLSMGTQDFVSNGGFINSRRGGRSNETSFLRRSLSLSQEPSHHETTTRRDIQVNSSPPLRPHHFDESFEQSRLSASEPVTPQETSVVHHTNELSRPASSGSPLKLFGNRDTYTNNKLMRILSQFEEPDIAKAVSGTGQSPVDVVEQVLRMSQFGGGDLDDFGFVQDVRKPSPTQLIGVSSEDRIFQPVSVISRSDQVTLAQEGHLAETGNHGSQAHHDSKDRTTKRRRTLLKDQVSLLDRELEIKVTELEETATLAGKKRKDARPGDEGVPADPDVLASRDRLRPKSTRKSSVQSVTSVPEENTAEIPQTAQTANEDLTEALAAELATFANEAAQVKNDSRKPSLATKDYMEEANKVMQFIRARGKPIPTTALPEIREPVDQSEINPDSILDLDLDAESTKDGFSRPPSRDHTPNPPVDRRHARHDLRVASYLRKYRDEDDLDVLGSTSILGTPAPAENGNDARVHEASSTGELQESEPPNIRVLEQSETLRKRKYSGSTVEQELGHARNHHSTDSSSQHSFPTSSSMGHKGVISSGTVSIPDIVGTMTFDHEKKIWVKKISRNTSATPKSRQLQHTMTEDDPFDSIPDLSIDEQQELKAEEEKLRNVAPQAETAKQTQTEAVKAASHNLPSSLPTKLAKRDDQACSDGENDIEDDIEEIDRSSMRSKASEHEAKLHDGIPSKPPAQLLSGRKQARVVTIAFSSPVVSGINYANLSEEDFSELPREEDLPLDDSDMQLDEKSTKREHEFATELSLQHNEGNKLSGSEQESALPFRPRTISPIVEDDEDQFEPQMSIVHLKHSKVVTPAPNRSLVKLQRAGNKASSILCLTPLSDFSLHQVDVVKDVDQSYVEDRKHPHALRQAHGKLSLAVDELVKAITDAAPDELFWDQLRHLVLGPASTTSVHNLKEYCPILEQLIMPENNVSQLGGLPSTLRSLDLHNSTVNDLTSWGHLQNLQYLDVSSCQLETLDGFSSLMHLRTLKANNNRISHIDGILDLEALLELELGHNDLSSADFEGCDLARLQRLDLSHNRLTEIKNLEFLPVLEELDVSYNELEIFVSGTGHNLTSLRELRLAHNNLADIGLKSMPTLRHLNLDCNRITDIQGLSRAYHLEYLSLREQDAQSDIVEFILTTPNECRKICLSSNPVVNGTFKLPVRPQNNLRELEIAACAISELPERFGMYFPNCRYLNLNFNAIKEIAPLRKMFHLKTLHLAKNRLQRLRRTCLVMSRLPSLQVVDIRDNPLTLGFYGPVQYSAKNEELCETRYHLPPRTEAEDVLWTKVLDEVTGLKRRTIELLLGEHCKELDQLDGLTVGQEKSRSEDATWNKLTSRGVLVKPAQEADDLITSPCGRQDDTNGAGTVRGGRTGTSNDGDVFDG